MSLGKKQKKANVTTATLSVLAQVFGILLYSCNHRQQGDPKQTFLYYNPGVVGFRLESCDGQQVEDI